MNNATGTFCECFHPLHPQFPLPLPSRLHFLQRMLESGVGLRLLAVKAIEAGLTTRSLLLYQGGGPPPLDARPPLTWGEAWDYSEDLAGLLMGAARSETSEVAAVVGAALPGVIANSAFQARPESAVKRMELVVEWALGGEVQISISDLAGELRRMCVVLSKQIDNFGPVEAAKLRACVERLEELTGRLEEGDFTTRLRRWAGPWITGDYEFVEGDSGEHIPRFVRELRILAEEAKATPYLLADDLLKCLRTSEAHKPFDFFRQLGKIDVNFEWLKRLERVGGEDDGAIVFAGYFAGLGDRDRPFASQRLDELAKSGRVQGEAILRATAFVGSGRAGVERVEKIGRANQITSFTAQLMLSADWVRGLAADDLVRLLEVLAGPELENALAIIRALSAWVEDLELRIEGGVADFIQRCLVATQPSLYNAYECDRVAAALAYSDPNRGFLLLRDLLRRPYGSEGGWEPVSPHNENRFWKALLELDRERALRLVLSLPVENKSLTLPITWDFRGVINQEEDADFLIAFALEDKRQAEVVAQIITAARPGFWLIAVKILEKYPDVTPDDELVHSGIEIGIYRPEGATYSWMGNEADHLESCRREVEQVLEDDAAPAAARPWLEAFDAHLRDRIEKRLVSEADEATNLYRSSGVEDSETSEKLFAIRKLLEIGKLDQVLQLLSRDELLGLLPKLGLSENEEEKLRREIEQS